MISMKKMEEDTPESPKPKPKAPVERLFPFIQRARVLIVGRETLERSKSRLQFLLITEDISDTSKKAILDKFRHYPIVQMYRSSQLEKLFGLHNTKLIGFKKSDLAKSLYQEIKRFRINAPLHPNKVPDAPATKTPQQVPED